MSGHDNMWTNYHTHSNFCDGKSQLSDVVTSALSKDIFSMGFSSHAPLPFEKHWAMRKENLQPYLKEIHHLRETHKNFMEIYAGLEVDYIPGITGPKNFSALLDYTIGSVHMIESFPDGRHWEIDGSQASFREGLDALFAKDNNEAIHLYFERTRQMVSESPPDIVGHFDKIKIQNINDWLFKESDSWYQDEIKKTLKAFKAAGVIVEVNTRGVYQKKTPFTYPSPWILELILKDQMPVTISSDAHHPDDLINYFPETAVTLGRIGFKKIRILLNGSWQDVAFDENGIKLN